MEFIVIVFNDERILLTGASQPIESSSRPRPMNSIDWEALYYEYLPRVFNFFLYRVGDEEMAEDLTAETFEKSWKHRQRYNQNLASFGTWLFSIARHVSIDHYRKIQNRSKIPNTNLESNLDSIEESVEKSENLMQLAQLLELLTEHEKELVALKYGSGMTNKEIALLIGLSETNVGTSLYRIVNKMRERWEGRK